MSLPDAFLTRPIAHRGYHDRAAGRVENSRAAFAAAIEAGYGIELDIQPSKDGVPMVFHDYALSRLTGETGPVAQRTAEELGQIMLTDGGEGIPTLAEVLALVDGRVPLLIEVKDQDGAYGENVGALEAATAAALEGYAGEVALMSFNPHSVAALASLAPEIPRGLTTEAFTANPSPSLPDHGFPETAFLQELARIGASFISHQFTDLAAAPVTAAGRNGYAILCWTIRSAAEEAEARKIAANVTFEGYAAA
ncbi:phosphodiesterase [Oceanicola sp. D3]|uniref:glycerophosphodiester phosphodiesterase family protein n=1 Tax=Oceanicola sp. D3 TaxID=2587163 RepID=UPI00111EB80F|nr:glycerophosphodiester phosphodiesterase family protein [Oceanicola sp. D3]QDC11344.1 phosphodiesterase [Oceanicola sp. D3]